MVQGCHHVPLHHWGSPLILTPPVLLAAHAKDFSSQIQGHVGPRFPVPWDAQNQVSEQRSQQVVTHLSPTAQSVTVF